MQDEVIHEFVRERIPGRGKQIVGVIAGTVVEGMIVMGWSKCNWKEGDKFDKQEGIGLAIDRARAIEPTPELPIQMKQQWKNFQCRCLRYFKDANVLSVKGPHLVKITEQDLSEQESNKFPYVMEILDQIFSDMKMNT